MSSVLDCLQLLTYILPSVCSMFIFMWACASLDCNITEASMLVVGLVMSTRGKIYPYFFFGVLL